MSALHHLGVRETVEPLVRAATVEESLQNIGGHGTAAAIVAAQAAREDVDVASEYSGLREESGAFHSFLEHASTYGFFLLFAAAIYLSFMRLAGQGRLWLVVFAVPLGLVAGDFISGFVHWLADTYGSERTPLVGTSFIKWFRLHHAYPKDICTHDFITTNGNTCIPAAPLVGFCLPLIWDEDASVTRVFVVLTTVLMTGATVATNQFHKWAHADAPPLLARWLQKARLILPPAHHARHHAAPFLAHYCITNGWLNPLLDRINFFKTLEGALRKVGVKRNVSEAGRSLDE
jgi:ubiquitin-conjugating enzyme E2 variant